MKIFLLFVFAICLFFQIDPYRVDNPSYRVSVLKDRYTLFRSDIFYFLETSPHRPLFQVKTAESCDEGKLYIYIFFFRFLFSQAQQESVMQRCGLAEPHHGENWCAVSKAIPNWRLRTKDILPIVAKSLKPIEKE